LMSQIRKILSVTHQHSSRRVDNCISSQFARCHVCSPLKWNNDSWEKQFSWIFPFEISFVKCVWLWFDGGVNQHTLNVLSLHYLLHPSLK
jgi:hypothetical protein